MRAQFLATSLEKRIQGLGIRILKLGLEAGYRVRLGVVIDDDVEDRIGDSRGTVKDSRGIPKDSRGIVKDIRGIPKDSRGIPNDSRGIRTRHRASYRLAVDDSLQDLLWANDLSTWREYLAVSTWLLGCGGREDMQCSLWWPRNRSGVQAPLRWLL